MRRLPALLAALALPAAAHASPRSVVEASFAAANRHDAAAMASFYAADAVVVSSGECRPQIGPEAVRAGHEALFKAMPDLRFAPQTWVEQGDRVALIFVARSRALAGSGERTFADFFTVRRGRIVRDVTVFNAGRPCR